MAARALAQSLQIDRKIIRQAKRGAKKGEVAPLKGIIFFHLGRLGLCKGLLRMGMQIN